MTYLPELRDSLVRGAAREYGDAAAARATDRVGSRTSLRSRAVRLVPVALAVSLTAVVAVVALTALRPARPHPHPSSRHEPSLISILGVLRGRETLADRAFRAGGDYGWNQAYFVSTPSVRYAVRAPWGDRLFVFAPPADGTMSTGRRLGVAPGYAAQSLEGELVGVPPHAEMIPYNVNGKYQYSVPDTEPYVPLTTGNVEAGRATFIWPGGQSYAPASNSSIWQLFGPKEEIAVVVPDGVTKVEFVLPRQPMAIVGAPVYPRVEHVTVPVRNNVAVAEFNRKCCYLPTAELSRLSLYGNETREAAGPMIWFGADGQVIKRIGDLAAAARVITFPTPGPVTQASRAAERDPSTSNRVWITPTVGGPRTQFHVHFNVLLTGAGYGYQLVRLTDSSCQIPGFNTGQAVNHTISGIQAGYEPNVVRGNIWDGALTLNPTQPTPLCPGSYRLTVSVVTRGVFGGYGANAAWKPAKPFGSTTFTVHH
jgi:hypothetical protein